METEGVRGQHGTRKEAWQQKGRGGHGNKKVAWQQKGRGGMATDRGHGNKKGDGSMATERCMATERKQQRTVRRTANSVVFFAKTDEEHLPDNIYRNPI